MNYEITAFIAISLAVLGVVLAIGRRFGEDAAGFLLVAVSVRIFGAFARHELIFQYYSGLGDAVRYYTDGLELTRQILERTLSPISPEYWALATARWGTMFIIQTSGVVLALIGPTLRGEFVVFSMFAWCGILALVVAFDRFHDKQETLRYAWLVVLWPSVWFWPSSVGKEALIVLAIGLTTLGYAGRDDRVRWLPLAAGLGLAFMVRPHIAFVLSFAVAAAEWLAAERRWTPARLIQAGMAAGVVFTLFRGMQARFGLLDADMEGMTEFIEWQMSQTLQGGSNIGAVSLGPGSIPIAFVNVWMRPFLWEAGSPTALVSALEIALLWWLVWRYRRGLPVLVRNWRRHRLARYSIVLLCGYTIMIGLTFGNMGLIARQRAPMFPFALLLLVALPRAIVERRELAAAESRVSAHDRRASPIPSALEPA